MPLIPLHDRNPRVHIRGQYVTVALIVLASIVFFGELSLNDNELYGLALSYGAVPALIFGEAELAPELQRISPLLTLVTYQFIHGDWSHLLFNMLFLWAFGDNIEDAMGHGRFIVFFVLCGVLAGLAHALVNPSSVIPTVGASGAISGLLGAYIVLHPRASILVLAFTVIPLRLPALMVIGTWFAQDVLWASLGSRAGDGIALWAHIGGFVAGALLIIWFRRTGVPLFDRSPGLAKKPAGSTASSSSQIPRSGTRDGFSDDERN